MYGVRVGALHMHVEVCRVKNVYDERDVSGFEASFVSKCIKAASRRGDCEAGAVAALS